MTRLVLVPCMLSFIVSCDDFAPPTEPSPSPAVEVITVGQQVNRTFSGLALYFELVAPKKGILVGALTWDGTRNGTVLLLKLNDTSFRPTVPGRFPMRVTARLQVIAGETIQIGVLGGGTDVTYDDPFVLATTLE
jgi:hypothetical protein